VLAGTGYRTDPGAHAEVAAVLDVEVLSLELVDPRFYHLDTCLAALDDRTIAYYPEAFSAASRDLLEALYPDAVRASRADAEVLGLNFVSDGRHVVLSKDAVTLAEQLRDADPPLVVDVRTEREWRQARIDDSLNIPLGELANRLDELPRERPIVVHCGSGYRSSIAASILRRAGVSDLSDMVGGLEAWTASTAA
jgi:rhodanese-related sulfurtransferase